MQDHHRPIRAILSELWGGLFAVDSRFWETLRVLLFRPGFLTRAYNDGQRIRYVRPLRLYIITSLILFTVVNTLDLQVVRFNDASSAQTQPDTTAIPAPAPVLDTNASADTVATTSNLGWIFMSEAMRQVDSVNRDFITRLPQVMFVLVPLFGWLVMVFYRKAKLFYTEHLIFALHTHVFAYIMFTLAGLWGLLFEDGEPAFFVLAVPLYVYLSLRRVYREGRVRTLFKLGGVLVIYLLFLFFGMLLTVFVLTLIRALPVMLEAI